MVKILVSLIVAVTALKWQFIWSARYMSFIEVGTLMRVALTLYE